MVAEVVASIRSYIQALCFNNITCYCGSLALDMVSCYPFGIKFVLVQCCYIMLYYANIYFK